MRTRPSPPSPRGDEIFGTFSLYSIRLPQTSRLSFPDTCFLLLFLVPCLLRQEYHMACISPAQQLHKFYDKVAAIPCVSIFACPVPQMFSPQILHLCFDACIGNPRKISVVRACGNHKVVCNYELRFCTSSVFFSNSRNCLNRG